jgi:pyruvate/2-oxoglutarate dehydrogenase complex dihydrolipoamide dehydrogenase (E3) component
MERAGIALDRGITVDRYLRTSVAGIFAAGFVSKLETAALRFGALAEQSLWRP